MRRGIARGSPSNLPVPKVSRGSPGSSKSLGRGANFAHSAEDIPRRVQIANGGGSPHRRAISPGNDQRAGLSVPGEQGVLSGVRYITEDLIKKIAKEDQLDQITTLNLTLAKEGGKKIKYIENLDKLKKLQVLSLSNNMIEKIEKLEKVFRLRELNLSYNNIMKIEGLENLTNLQVLNMTGNNIEHIPVWLAKRLRAVRTLHLGKNNLQSLNELAKLKPIPGLTHLTVAENPVAQLPHYRQYLVFHIRSLEVLDSQPVTERDRQAARDRFEQDELERLEKQLEQEESKVRKFEEEKNLSAQESSLLKVKEEEMRRQQRMSMDRLQEMERELSAKDDLLKKKTSELNKACEKHYQLEQELAFFKIDAKFDSLGKSPSFHQDGDDSGGLGESPYIGRARYKANQFARDSDVSGSPQQHASYHVQQSPQRAEIMDKLNTQLDHELAAKKDRVQKTEDRLKRLTDDLMGTERKLLQATKDLKRMGDIPDKDDMKVQIRQKLAKKMQLVNELRDSATQIEEEIEKTQNSMHQNKVDVARLKGQLERLDSKDPKYKRTYAEMVDKEQQISESNQMYGQLQQQLEVMLDTISRETEDIKKLEQQLNDDRVESNDSLRNELDEIVGGLQGYLSNVKQKGLRAQREYETLLGENIQLQDKVGKLEQELGVMDQEASKVQQLEHRLMEMEGNLVQTQDLNRTLEDQLHRTRSKDAEYQDKLENTSHELFEMKRALKDAEKKVQSEKLMYERQVQTEKERAEKALKDARAKSSLEDEVRRLQNQLDSTRDQLEGERRKLNESIPHGELKKRLKDLSSTVKAGRSPVSPQSDRDFLGKTFKDIQQFVQDNMNRSFKDIEHMKKSTQQADAEIQTLKDHLNKAENKLARRDEKDHGKVAKLESEKRAINEERKRLENEIQRIRAQMKEIQEKAAQGRPIMKIVYRPESESDRSSLNSEEKALYDELQRELLELRKNMRSKEETNAKRLAEVETEAALLEQMVKEQEDELMKTREENDLEKEKHEARMQVIAQDLEQAQMTADHLQGMLDDREQMLHSHAYQSDVNNQMINAQEDELTKLYDILEAQREEIENLNGLLDRLVQQGAGADAVDPGFDDELWKLRQEVNRLKETLAMQSAYIQTMPQPMTSSGTQAQMGGTQTQGVPYQGQTAGLPYKPNLSQHQMTPVGIFPQYGSRAAMGTSYVPPGGGVHASDGIHPHFGQNVAPQMHVGAGQGDDKTPFGARPAGRSRSSDGRLGGSRRPGSRGGVAESDRGSQKSGRSGRSGRERSGRDRQRRSSNSKTAFEPVHKPQAYRPVMSAGPTQTYSTPHHAVAGIDASTGHPVGGAPTSGQAIGGYQPLTGTFRGGPQGVVPPGIQHIGAPIGSGGVPVQNSGYSAVGPIQNSGYVGGAPVVSATGGFATQTPGHAGTQTPGYGVTQTPGYASVQTPGHMGAQTSGPQGVQAGYPIGQTNYVPVSANQPQRVGYNSGRMFLPAYSTSPERPAGRVYYSGPGSGGGPHGGAPPPPPPPPPPAGIQLGPPSPGPRVTFLPLNPVATGTPVTNRTQGFTNVSSTVPPSPIVAGSLGMEAGQPRGILKNAETMGDDSYLFCNVPEHHDLEDYIAELQEKLKKMKGKILRDQELQKDAEDEEDSRLIRRLRGELEQRRDELESLDLAIERQKKSLKDMKKEEKHLEFERMAAKDELHFMKVRNTKEFRRRQLRAKVFEESDEDDHTDPRYLDSRRKFLQNEIVSLEGTLTKRKQQLNDADKLLKDCNFDLRDAREQARETVAKYDNATQNLKTTVKETNELERRANEAGVELIKASDTLSAIRSEIKDMEKKKGKQERLLRDINQVMAKRDTEYRDLDSRVRSSTQTLHRLHSDISASTHREKETMAALRDAEEVLTKRRSEIARMQDQIEQQRDELEKMDQKMGKKRTEFQLLQESMERRSTELSAVLHEAEAEVVARQRDARELKEKLKELDLQKSDLIQTLKSKRNELHKKKEEVETEEEVLQKLVNSVNKHKTELKHTFEMQKLEKTELESLKAQHALKLSDLEKTQRELVEEKSQLEQLSAETSRKASEVERLRQILDRDRQEVERLSLEKQSLEDRMNATMREKDLLDGSCKDLDNKLNHMKRTHKAMEDKIDTTTKRLDNLETELRIREKEMEEANQQRAILQKDIQSLKLSNKDGRSELKSLKEQIRDSDDQLKNLTHDLKDTYHRRDDAKLEYERLNEAVRQSRLAHDDYMRQEKQKQSELQELLKNVNEKSIEYQEAKMALNKIRKDVEREESKLNKLVSNANLELDNIRSDLQSKQFELEQATMSVSNLKRESEKLHVNEEKFMVLDKQIKDLEREVHERNEEKNELAKALSRSYEELQKLRTESAQEQERMTRERLQLENALHDIQSQLEQAKQEMKHMQNRTNHQVTELKSLAEIQFSRANRLGDELTKIRKDNKEMRRKLLTKNDKIENEKDVDEYLQELHLNLDEAEKDHTIAKHREDLDPNKVVPPSVVETKKLYPLQSSKLTAENKENIFSDSNESSPKENIKGKLTEEQDLLRHQLQEQMRRHAEAMETARMQSEGTIESLRQKMNALQEVLVNTGDPSDAKLSLIKKRSRSSSPKRSLSPTRSILDTTIRERQRSTSPRSSRRGYLAQRPRSRSRSYERSTSPIFPERDLLTA